MTFDGFMVWSNLCPSCCGNTGRLLHGMCKANCGPWASWLKYYNFYNKKKSFDAQQTKIILMQFADNAFA